MDQPEFAERAGLTHARVRAIFGNDANKTPPTIDELLAMADAAGVPEAFALHGFDSLYATALETQIKELSDAVAKLLVDNARHNRALRALGAENHLAEHPAEGG